MFIWLGDVSYMYSNDIARAKDPIGYYKRRLNDTKLASGYSRIKRIIGTWDDNDYGKNDGGRRFKDK